MKNLANLIKMIKVGTTFSGIGAPEQALKNLKTPHELCWACDIDKDAYKTYAANHSVKNWYPDITKIQPAQLEPVDLYVWGFPCQSVSSEGAMEITPGEKTALVEYSLDILDVIKPKYSIFENVRGLLFPRFSGFYQMVVDRISQNYNFHLYKVDSKDFGVPHARPRVYGIGVRKDLGWKPNNFKFNKSKTHLSSILEPNPDEKYFISQERVQKILETCRTKQKGFVYYPDKVGEVKHVRSNGFQPDKKIRYSGNSFCLTCSVHHGIMKDGRIRKFTPRECARLQGFPDTFEIPVNDSLAFEQFGNAMTVNVVQQMISNLLFL